MAEKVTRRTVLARMGATGAAAALTPLASRGAPQDRPNFLFITTDDQRWDAMSCMGHPFIRTPHMDRLAREGVRFANAFVTISLCAPSRGCFHTGMHAHSHGVRTNEGIDIDQTKTPSYSLLLQKAGYDTAFIGKWHQARTDEPRPGFDYWLSFRGQGVYHNPTLNENGRKLAAKGYMTDLLTDYAVTWLRKPRTKPWSLCLWHKAVHGPFTPAPRHRDLYPDARMPKPPSFDDTFEGKPRWQRAAFVRGARRAQWLRNRNKPVPDKLPLAQWNGQRPHMLNYYRALHAVDEGMGKVFQALAEMGQLDNTVVIFAGDNGYFHGEHRRGDKRLAYEESMRIPLLLRYPKLAKAGSVPEQMVLGIDIAPTILDLAGVPVPQAMQGRSLRPLLEGAREPWRRSFLYEYFIEGWLPAIPTMLAVRTSGWKYVTYPEIDDIPELYDLSHDPREMNNLAEDPRHRAKRDELAAELERLKKATAYTPWVKPKPKVYAGPPQLVLHYPFDSDTAERATDASGKKNHGKAIQAPLAEGRTGKARRFDGAKGYIQVDKAKSLDLSNAPFTLAAWVHSQRPSGVVVARGGESLGTALYLRGGSPVFAVREAKDATELTAKAQATGRWVHLAASLTAKAEMVLYVDGKPVGRRAAAGFLSRDPNDTMQIGTDMATRAGTYTDAELWFAGRIDDVRIYRGELSPTEVAKLANAK